MYETISPILQWINAHPHLAGLATFIISAAESIAIVGTIVPGSVMMTAIGTLAGAGVMPLWSTILWAILGAIVGDSISYWIGFYFKNRLRDIWPFRSYPNLLATGEKFFCKHGGKSVFIGRFVGPVRALVPLIAGMLRMKPSRFAISNVASAIGWAPAYMLPGIALGAASLELPPDLAAHAILMLLLIGLFILLCLWFLQRLFLLIGTQINYGLTKLWHHLQMSRYFSLITTALKHYDIHKTYGQLKLAFYFCIISAAFLYLAAYVLFHGSQNIFINDMFYHMFRGWRSPTGDSIMVCITLLGESKVLLPLIATLFLLFALKKHWRTAWHVLALGVFTVIGSEAFKHIIHSPRPWGIVHSPAGASFPSGHATISTVIFLGLALLLTKAFNNRYQRFFYRLSAVVIIAICISRMYVGAHWFTDVLGGVLLGSSILMLIVLSYNRKAEKPLRPFHIIATTLLTLLISYGFYFHHDYSSLKANSTQLDWPTNTITLNDWWNQTGDHLPFYRLNRFGLSSQILSLQWIGDLEKIKELLLQNGWDVPQELNWITVLHRVSNVESTEHLPLVSPLYLDKKPVLVLIRHSNNNKKLIVLRLWQSFVTIQNINQPLWVGTVELVPSTYSWLLKPRRYNEINLTPEQLFPTKPTNYDIKQVNVQNNHRHRPTEQMMILIKPKGI